jgi:hypothetical protein
MSLPMYKYSIWVRLRPTHSTFTVLWAFNDHEARRLAEAQYGPGCVLGIRRVADGKP